MVKVKQTYSSTLSQGTSTGSLCLALAFPIGVVAFPIMLFLSLLAFPSNHPFAEPFRGAPRAVLWTPLLEEMGIEVTSQREEGSRNFSDSMDVSGMGSPCNSQVPLGVGRNHSAGNESAAAGASAVHVFYHIFTGDGSKNSTDHASSIIQEQQLAIRDSGLEQSVAAVHYTVLGSKWQELVLEPTTVYQKATISRAEGFETLTLQLLWEHCTRWPNDKVLYIHNKGSFHPSPSNEYLRRAHMRSLLDPCCLTAISSSLSWEEWEGLDNAELGRFKDMGSGLHDVCGMRFSPVPHSHFSGNMWWARCDYIRRLIPPNRFEDAMGKLARTVHRPSNPSCFGGQRYASEHWVASHPSARVVDNLPVGSSRGNTTFTWGYSNIPDAAANPWEPVCSRAFRTEIPLVKALESSYMPCAPFPSARWKEYAALYGNESLLQEGRQEGGWGSHETNSACLFSKGILSLLEGPDKLGLRGLAEDGVRGWLDDYKNATVRLKCQS